MFKAFICVILIQVLLEFLQFQFVGISDLFKVISYEKDGVDVIRLEQDLATTKMVTGTLLSSANLASVLTITTLALIFYFNDFQKKFGTLIFIFICLIGVILTGVRSPLVAFFVVVGLILFIKRPFIFTGVIFILVFLYGFFYEYIIILSSLSSQRSFGFENPLLRMAGVFTLLESSGGDSSSFLTFGRTIDLISSYDVLRAFGNGTQLLNGDYESQTDAFLVLLFIDYGWVTFSILLLPYLYLISLTRKVSGYKNALFLTLLLLMLLIQTIVDEGLWYNTANFTFVFACGLLISMNKKNEHSNSRLRTGESW